MKLITLLIILSTSFHTHADVGLFVGAGGGLSFPGTVRLEIDDWEAGLLTPTGYGLAKILEDDPWYVGFGPFINPGPIPGYGLYGSLGGRYRFWKIFAIRGELSMVGTHTGYLRGEGIAGLEVRF